MLWCVLRMFFTANTICENLGYCVVVEYVCVVCSVSVQALCQCNVCVGGSCVCARVWWWYAFGVVSGCLSVCVHVLFGCVVICSCAVRCWCSWFVCVCLLLCATTLCCVVALNNRHTHTMNTNATLHMKTPTNPMILVFRTKQTSGGSKVKEHPRFSFTVQLSFGP